MSCVELGRDGLRQVAQEITEFNTEELQTIEQEMLTEVKQACGVGIAACQIGYPQNMCIIRSFPNGRYPSAPEYGPETLLNPKVVSIVPELEWHIEGCLSIPGLRGWVPRFKEITIEYQDMMGQGYTKTYQGFLARIVQHEIDHCNGFLFIDRVESSKDLLTEKSFQTMLKESHGYQNIAQKHKVGSI